MNVGEWVILDTHIWIWWLEQNGKLPRQLSERIDVASRVAVSAASVYEVSLAVRRQRLTLTLELHEWLGVATDEAGIAVLSIDGAIAKRAAELPQVHGDPLDRIIIATALVTNACLFSLDGKFGGYKELQGALVSG